MMSKREKWVVRLGAGEWSRFARESKTQEYQLLGSVRHGARIGALAITPDGRYLQINGDYVSSLNASRLRQAVQAATSCVTSRGGRAVAASHVTPPPVVVIKRRRVPVPA